MRVIKTYLEKKILNSIHKIDAYQIKKIVTESHELYSIHQKLESIRCSSTVDYSVELHANVSKKSLGESKAEFQPIKKKWKNFIDEAIEMCGYIQNPYYEYSPKYPFVLKDNIIFDPLFSEDIHHKIKEINDELESISREDIHQCFLISFEVFLKKHQTYLKNHRGLEIKIPSSKIIFDYVLHSPNKKHEINDLISRRFFEDMPFIDILKDSAKKLLDLENAILPPTGDFSVILTDQALDTIFEYFIQHASAHALYHKYSVFELNKSIYSKTPKEALSLSVSPFLRGGLFSGFIDSTGYPLEEVCLIDKGIFKNFLIDGKYSHYLNTKRTSGVSNTIVQGGNTSYSNFISDGVFELHQFSTFTPNGITGAFSGEIRLGYLHKNGKKIPIRGGSVSGITQNAFLNCYFSKETCQRESYLGPKGIFFEKLTLAGN